MTSKDYLKQIAESKGVCPLTNDVKDNALLFPIGFEKIFQDLDKLEELRDLYEIATKGNWNLKEENTKLKMAIEIILKYKINPSTFIFTRKIYKESCGKDLTFEKAYSLSEFDGTQEEYELLKEVLENEI